jgi:deazaflavin-dependent oxidoreductase (nitroreductase family)
MQAPRIMRRLNRAFTNPLMRPLAGLLPPLAVVHHAGRKSGRAYRTPVLALPVEGGFVTPLPYGTDTDWCRNVVAAGGCEIERLGRQVGLDNPHILDAEAALPLLPALLRPVLKRMELPGYLVADRVDAD